jgi:CRP/FNR family transcriptional regulator, nitrogen fixation regulation protein
VAARFGSLLPVHHPKGAAMSIIEPGIPAGERISAGNRRSLASREIICHQGYPTTGIFRVEEGAVMLYQILHDGRRQVVDLLRAGDYFGFGDGEVHDCFAETLSECEVTAWSRGEALGLVLSHGFARALQRKVGAMHDHATLLGRKTALERVASMLMRLVPQCGGRDCIGSPPAGSGDVMGDFHLSRQEMADYLGLTLETVSRVMSQLRRDGLITSPKPSQVVINDPCRLCRLAAL